MLLDNNEFGIKHPHESDFGESCSCEDVREALVRCVFAILNLSSEMDRMNDEIDALKKKELPYDISTGNGSPLSVMLRIYDGYVDIDVPDILSEDKLADLLIEVGINLKDEVNA